MSKQAEEVAECLKQLGLNVRLYGHDILIDLEEAERLATLLEQIDKVTS